MTVLVGYALLRGSLPQLDGNYVVTELSAPVRIERDQLGVPTITAANRADLAFATGFVHGQDRFFQMDLSRRLAAGELAELVGKVALSLDRSTRVFRFRHVAQQAVAQASPEDRRVIEAYVQGVNAGLSSLRSRPWEYWVLGSRPAPWVAEDTILATEAMWWDLQSEAFEREILRHELNERLGGPVCAGGWKCALGFFYPARTVWDAPDDPVTSITPVTEASDVPAPEALDLRHSAAQTHAAHAAGMPAEDTALGSNNWAVAGRLTANGSALVASDMHLGQSVPATWYKARLRVGASLDLNGVTLPGAPVLVAGTNGRIAWGFTNSYGDWFDVSFVPCTAIAEDRIETPASAVKVTHARELIRVRFQADEPLDVISAPAGVLVQAHPERQSCWLASWLAQDPAGTNLRLMGLEQADSAAAAVAVAPEAGIPHQNLVVGDRDGHIAWSIFGRIPASAAEGRSRGTIVWTTSANHPSLFDPPLGRIWTANGRVTSDPGQEAQIGGALAPLGAEYDLGARQQQVRDDLLALKEPVKPADMLPIQLDDQARFMTHWRDHLLQLLDEAALAGHADRAEFRRLLQGWNGRASTDAVSYRLVRTFRDRMRSSVWEMIVTALNIPESEHKHLPSQFEHALWQLVSAQPMHLLASRYADWRAFELEQVDAALAQLARECGQLERCTWGRRNTVAISHPLSDPLPFLRWLINMPVVELPGDSNMPRVQVGTEGASERFAVSPGHESEGYFHMPGGQSGNPLSPYYKAGFLQWVRGQPLPFLPGPAEHTLTLQPQ
jgi:penicillin amidase